MVKLIDEDSDLPAPLDTAAKQEKYAKQLASTFYGKKALRASGVPFQGSFSRTRTVKLVGGDHVIIQFRVEPLDYSYFHHARSKLGPIVPTVTEIPDEELNRAHVTIYTMPCLRGIPRLRVRDGVTSKSAVAASLGRILARGYISEGSGQLVEGYLLPELKRIRSSSHGANDSLRPHIERLIAAAPALSSLPLWITHYDLSVTNVLVVDDKSWQVSGIVDWELSRDLPFGIGLHRIIDNMIAVNIQGNLLIPLGSKEIEAAFWDSMWAALPESNRLLFTAKLHDIQNAIHIGALLHYCAFPVQKMQQKHLPFWLTALTYQLPQLRGTSPAFLNADYEVKSQCRP